MWRVVWLCLAADAAGFQAATTRVITAARAVGPLMMSTPGLPDVASLVQQLADSGIRRSQVEDAFASALVAVYEAPPPPPPPPPTGLRPPSTASDAQAAFRAAYTGRLVTSTTQKFLNSMIEDRACVFKFEYSRVYALGLTALCDAFLPMTCIDEFDAAETRNALCFGLGLDAATVAADAKALAALAAGSSKEELFASADLSQIAQSRSFKYTYTFGVGLVMLMRAVGETQLTARGYGRSEAGEGAVDRWCAELSIKNANTLVRDTERPLNIDGVGRFSFEEGSGIEVPKADPNEAA